ncbi:MAG: ACP S-malonyltransferase [Chloroflexota bacterium]
MVLDPQTTAFVFPGQGSQVVGMGRALAESDSQAAAVFRQAEHILETPLSQICWQGPADVLNDTLNTQPALLTHSVAVLRALQARFPSLRAAFAAGHSLGEFSALVAAGAISFADALRLVRARGQAMRSAGECSPGGMAAVLGLEASEVEQVCLSVAGAGGTVQVANDNCPGQVVISGDETALRQAIAELERHGAKRVVRLAVSIAAHSPLMHSAQDEFNRALDAAPIRDPEIPVVGNVSAAPLQTAAQIRADLNAQLTSQVRWADSIRRMVASGVRTFLELGSGSVLTGLLRRIDPATRGIALDAPESFQLLLG